MRKKKSVEQVATTKRRVSGKEPQLFKTTSTASLTNRHVKARKDSNEQRLVKTTSSVNVTNKSKSRKASQEAESAAKDKPMSRKSSTVGRKPSETSPIKRSASNASTVSVGAKSRENTFVKRSSSKQLLPEIDSDTSLPFTRAVTPTAGPDTAVVPNDR